MSGLVAAIGFLNLTASVVSGTTIINSKTNSMVLFQRVLNEGDGPEGYGAYDNLLTDENVFIDPTTQDNTAYLNIPIQIGSQSAEHLIIEAQVRIVGLRAGIADPGSGFVGARFQDDYHNVTPIDIGAYGYRCPFQIKYIAAFFA